MYHKLPSSLRSFLAKNELTSKIVNHVKINVVYRNEKLFVKGFEKAKSSDKTVLFFTVHKCASVYVESILKILAKDEGLIHLNLENYFTEVGQPVQNPEVESRNIGQLFRRNGYLYGPFRIPHRWSIPSFEEYKVLLMLRDPRDVLTSLYFSRAYSHSLATSQVSKFQIKQREEALSKSIDQWVLDTALEYVRRYQFYCDNFLSHPNVFFVRYEDMVASFDIWLENVVDFLEFDDVKSKTLQKILNDSDFEVGAENIYSHKRQVQPGDHLRKLQPETINKLNILFGDLLNKFGYS